MSNLDNGFAKAQRAYDNMLPPEQPDPMMDKCGECSGHGILTDEQGNEEPCHVCKGEGEVEIEPEEHDCEEDEV